MAFEIDEDYVELNVVDIAVRYGFFERKVVWQGRRNAPDRVFAHSRLPREIWIEFKKPGEKPRTGQRIEHTKMRAAGMEVYACDSIAEGCRILGLPVPPMTPEGRLL